MWAAGRGWFWSPDWQGAPWGQWQWGGITGEGHSVQGCVWCTGTASSHQSSAAPFPPLDRPWQCPSCALSEAHREPPSAAGTGQALGAPRHSLGCGESRTISCGAAEKAKQTKQSWHCHCFPGKEELMPVPNAYMEKMPHLLQPEWSGSNKVNARFGNCGCRELWGGCGFWVVLLETWNVTNACLTPTFHTCSSMHLASGIMQEDLKINVGKV